MRKRLSTEQKMLLSGVAGAMGGAAAMWLGTKIFGKEQGSFEVDGTFTIDEDAARAIGEGIGDKLAEAMKPTIDENAARAMGQEIGKELAGSIDRSVDKSVEVVEKAMETAMKMGAIPAEEIKEASKSSKKSSKKSTKEGA